MAVTIKNIAEAAGVSMTTVSLVINGRPGVSPATRERVLKIMEELNYRPLRAARRLATRKTGNIGFILWEGHFSEIEMFYSRIFLGMELAARAGDYYILLTTVKDTFVAPRDLPRFLKNNDVDGIALAGRVPRSLVDTLVDSAVPFVLIDYDLPGTKLNRLLIDNYHGAYDAVEYLLDKGYQRPAFVAGAANHPSIAERRRGYRSVLEARGLSTLVGKLEFTTNDNITREIGATAARYFLQQDPRPDCVFCANDTLALGFMQTVQEAGLRVPDDMAVVGFDDIYATRYSNPPLSTVHVPKIRMGKEAYKLLQSAINDPEHIPQTRTVGVEFVARQST